jgi:hypothetical protein
MGKRSNSLAQSQLFFVYISSNVLIKQCRAVREEEEKERKKKEKERESD